MDRNDLKLILESDLLTVEEKIEFIFEDVSKKAEKVYRQATSKGGYGVRSIKKNTVAGATIGASLGAAEVGRIAYKDIKTASAFKRLSRLTKPGFNVRLNYKRLAALTIPLAVFYSIIGGLLAYITGKRRYSCKKFGNPIKYHKCMIVGIDKAITELNKLSRKCNRSEDPGKCKKMIQDKIKMLEDKKKGFEMKISRFKDVMNKGE